MYLQLSLLRRSRQKSTSASPRECTQSAPDFIQIGSLSRSYTRTREHHENGAVKCFQYSAEA